MSTDQITDLGTLDAELAKESMRGLWVREEALRREPAPFGKPMLWKWSKIREGLEAGWEAGDFFVVPNWSWHRHTNFSASEPAILFSTTDRPLHEAIGVYREESGNS